MQVRYGWGEIVGLVWPAEEEQREVLAVDSEMIRSVARTLFAPENLNLVAVGPVSDDLRKAVASCVADYEVWYRNR
jgi:hypothetical protein